MSVREVKCAGNIAASWEPNFSLGRHCFLGGGQKERKKEKKNHLSASWVSSGPLGSAGCDAVLGWSPARTGHSHSGSARMGGPIYWWVSSCPLLLS